MKYFFTIALIFPLFTLIPSTFCISEDLSSEKHITSIYKSHYPALVHVSPKGSHLIFKNYDYANFILETYNLQSKQTTSININVDGQFGPSISNHENFIAYFVDPAGTDHYQLIIQDLSSNIERRISTDRIINPKCYWSQDDRFLAYISADKLIKVIDLENNGKQITLSSVPILERTEIAWSNLTDTIAFITKNKPNVINMTNLAKNDSKEISIDKNEKIGNFSWLKTKEQLLVVSNKDQYYTLKYLALDSKLELPIILNKEVTELATSNDDRHIALSYNDGFEQKYNLIHRKKLSIISGDGKIIRVGKSSNEVFIQNNDPNIANVIRSDFNGRSEEIYRKTSRPSDKVASKLLRISSEKRDVETLLWVTQSKDNPLLLVIHGGPHVNIIKSWNAELQAYLENNIDVAYINYGGSSGYDSNFMKSTELAVPDITKVIEGLKEQFKYKDIYLLGDSYGTNLALESYSLQSKNIRGLILRSLLKGPNYESPLPLKLLLFQGQNDYLASPNDAIRRLSKTNDSNLFNRMVNLQDEGHSFHRINTWAEVLNKSISMIRNSNLITIHTDPR